MVSIMKRTPNETIMMNINVCVVANNIQNILFIFTSKDYESILV